MRKALILSFLLLFFLGISVQIFADYDRNAVVNVMRSNGTLLGEVQQAAKSGDFYRAAQKLMAIAENMKALDAYTPPRGSKAQWDRNHWDLVKAAFRGIGACGEEDIDKLNTAIGEISGYIREGHSKFR